MKRILVELDITGATGRPLNRWLWIMDNHKVLYTPIPFRGMQGLWTVPDNVFRMVEVSK